MGKVVSALLGNCREAIFIDPYFDPDKLKYRRTFEHFFQAFISMRRGPLPYRIEVHTSDRLEPMYFHDKCLERMPWIIPLGLNVIFTQWRERADGEKLHNRYILTDIGGVDFNVGLDEGDAGPTDDVKILSKERYKTRWRQYASDNPAFDRVGKPTEIIGGKPLTMKA